MLHCTSCKRKYNEGINLRCECGEPVEFPLQTGDIKQGDTVWERYDDFFPNSPRISNSLGEGNTPFIKGNKLSKKFGLNVYLKNETQNPTWSFKDRGTFIGINKALESRIQNIGTVSTGNMAASVAAYGRRFDINTKILVSSDISEKKLDQISIYQPNIIKVRGNYGELYYKSLDLGRKRDIYFINSDDPYRIEGYKSISYEIYEEGNIDYVIIPTSSGGLFRGITKGFLELKESGYLDNLPRFVSVQSKGCSPIYNSYQSRKKEITMIQKPKTIAKAIANPFPPSGNEVLRKLKRLDTLCLTVSDKEIIKAQKEIAKEGIFCQPASATGIAALNSLVENEDINKDDRFASIVTGSGLKSNMISSSNKFISSNLEDLEYYLD